MSTYRCFLPDWFEDIEAETEEEAEAKMAILVRKKLDEAPSDHIDAWVTE